MSSNKIWMEDETFIYYQTNHFNIPFSTDSFAFCLFKERPEYRKSEFIGQTSG